MRGVFTHRSYRDKLHAQLASLYGPTFEADSWWYRHPDEGKFFAAVFSMVSGAPISPEQANGIFSKVSPKKVTVDVKAMKRIGLTEAKLAALFAKTPGARGVDAGDEGCIIVEPGEEKTGPEGEQEPKPEAREETPRPDGSDSAGSSQEVVADVAEAAMDAEERAAGGDAFDDDDDDNATVVAEDFNDEVLDEEDDAVPALPMGQSPVVCGKKDRETADSQTLIEGLDFLASQSMEFLATEAADDPLQKELLAAQYAFENVNAMKKNLSMVQASAADAVTDPDARRALEGHLEAARAILDEQIGKTEFCSLFAWE